MAVDCGAPLDGVAVTVTVYAPAVVPGFPPPVPPPLLPQLVPTTTMARMVVASKTALRRFLTLKPSRNIEAKTAPTSPINRPLGPGLCRRLEGTAIRLAAVVLKSSVSWPLVVLEVKVIVGFDANEHVG